MYYGIFWKAYTKYKNSNKKNDFFYSFHDQ